MLYYEQVFGHVFERKKSKCCGVLMKHRRKLKSEQVIILQIAQQLKAKNINPVPGQLFCRQGKFQQCNKFQSATDTDNEFTGCQTPRKKLQSIGISPVSSQAFMKYFRSIQRAS